jgi:hypothetical protein
MKPSSYGAFVRAIGCALTLLWIAGCGAGGLSAGIGGGGGVSPAGGGGGTGGGGSGASGGGTAAITWTQRNAVMDATGAMLAKMSPTGDRDAQNAQLAAYAKTLAGVKDAIVLEDRIVTVVFQDGTQYGIMNNLILTGSRGEPLQSRAAGVAARPPQFSTRSVGSASGVNTPTRVEGFPDLPQSSKAVVMKALGADWNFGNDADRIQNLLNDGKYQVQRLDPTLENLSTLAGAGVVYYCTHGGWYYRHTDHERSFVLWTTTPAPRKESEYTPQQKAWYDAGMIEPMQAMYGWDHGTPIEYRRWAITEQFIQKYWKLDRNSIVVFDACQSADYTLARVMKNVCSAYLGWDNNINLAKPSLYLFDRLLGANSYLPEDPKQRPFDLEAVLDDMAKQKLDRNGDFAKLQYSRGNLGNFGLLAPTIRNMTVDEQGKTLKIYGEFGDEPGSGGIVSVGGTVMNSRTWTPDEIDIKKLPDTASGDVYVQVRNHKSNVARLTDWRGQIRYYWNNDGSEQVTGTIDLHVRADVRAYRSEPHVDPTTHPVDFEAAYDTKAHFVASGSFTQGQATTTWKGISDPLLKPTLGAGLFCIGTVDPQAQTLDLALEFGTGNDLTYTFQVPGAPPQTGALPLSTDPLDGLFNGSKPAPSIKLKLGVDLSIPSGQRSQLGPEGNGTARFVWDTITPTSKPDPESSRSVQRR